LTRCCCIFLGSEVSVTVAVLPLPNSDAYGKVGLPGDQTLEERLT
jgi:hypothetical protein